MDFESAKADCQRAVALAPGDLEAEGRLAQILLLKGEIAEAAEIFDRLYRLTPENAAIALGMVGCKIKLGQLEEVKTLLDCMAAIHANNPAVLGADGWDLVSGFFILQLPHRQLHYPSDLIPLGTGYANKNAGWLGGRLVALYVTAPLHWAVNNST
jgi:tetratricopeptide (TPR) repeat protein